MGCAVSKLEREDLRPGLYSIQRKIMEVKRPPRRGRRLSTVSTTELLRSEDADGGEHGVDNLAGVEDVEELPTAEPEEEEEEKGRRLGQRVAEGNQLPGSPSFRFYFAGSTHADESDDHHSRTLRNTSKLWMAQNRINLRAAQRARTLIRVKEKK